MEKLVIAGREFNSRLFLGTGKFRSNEQMKQAILASEKIGRASCRERV